MDECIDEWMVEQIYYWEHMIIWYRDDWGQIDRKMNVKKSVFITSHISKWYIVIYIIIDWFT